MILDKLACMKYSSVSDLPEAEKKKIDAGVHTTQVIKSLNQKYVDHVTRLRDFFNSRIIFIVETTLEHIELDEFLEHIVKLDDYLSFSELK